MKKVYTPEQRKCHLRNLAALAMKDGKMAQSEKELLEVVAREWGLSSKEVHAIAEHPNEIEFIVPESADTRFALLYDVVEMAIIDGELKNVERDICDAMAQRMGFPPDTVRTIINGILEGNRNLSDPDDIRESVHRKLQPAK